MKYIILLLISIYSISFGQTNSVVEMAPVIINFTKNDSGEVVLKIQGHSQPVEIHFNGVKTGTLYEQDSSVNLSQLGFESAFLSLDTASGKTAAAVDAQAPVIPPVSPSISPNPPLSTPF